MGAVAILGVDHVIPSSCVFVHVLFASTWFLAFPCPACESEWFGTRDGEYWRSALGLVLSQKVCNHCGLPKFMDPAGWDVAEVVVPDDAG